MSFLSPMIVNGDTITVVNFDNMPATSPFVTVISNMSDNTIPSSKNIESATIINATV